MSDHERSSEGIKLTFLGTGGSFGVPMIGCRCHVCRSSDPRNKRLRTSALLEFHGRNVLIDTSPDMRQQALTHGVDRLDAVLYTHEHADHVGGVDDLRAYNLRQQGELPCYANERTLKSLRSRFGYIFSSEPSLGSRPRLELCELYGPFSLWGQGIVPLDVWHGKDIITGYRAGPLAYITDASDLPRGTIEAIRDVPVLVLNALRHEPHPMHLALEQAVSMARRVGAGRTYLIHLGHELEYEATNRLLPPDIRLAYDGLILRL